MVAISRQMQGYDATQETESIIASLEKPINDEFVQELNVLAASVNKQHGESLESISIAEESEIDVLQEAFAGMTINSKLNTLDQGLQKSLQLVEFLKHYNATEAELLLQKRTLQLQKIYEIKDELTTIVQPTKQKQYKYLLDNHPEQYQILMHNKRNSVAQDIQVLTDETEVFFANLVGNNSFITSLYDKANA